MLASGVLSKRLATVEELFVSVTLDQKDNFWENNILWRRFYQQFPSVKTLRTEDTNSAHYIARALHRDLIDLALLSALEEIDLGEKLSTYEKSQRESLLAAFQPFVSARQQVGRPVKVLFGP